MLATGAERIEQVLWTPVAEVDDQPARHPGRSEAESRDPGADAPPGRLGPGSARLRRSARDDGGEA
jgi:hypothetical protein